MQKKKHMDRWGSYMDGRFGDIVTRIEATGVPARNCQVGNVINMLTSRREFDLIAALEDAISTYNESVDQFNARVDFTTAVYHRLQQYKRDEAYSDTFDDVFPDGVWHAYEEFDRMGSLAVDAAVRSFEGRLAEYRRLR